MDNGKDKMYHTKCKLNLNFNKRVYVAVLNLIYIQGSLQVCLGPLEEFLKELKMLQVKNVNLEFIREVEIILLPKLDDLISKKINLTVY